MALTTIAASKDSEQAYTPLLLAEFRFADGSVLRLASQNLTAAAGFAYGGHDYLCRIVDQSIGQLASITETGIDMPPAVSLQIADADRYLMANFHLAESKGFKDADLVLRLILWDHGTTTFSSDSAIKFSGKCEAPEFDGRILTVRANSLVNVAKTNFPIVARQARCPWSFPVTVADRQAAADDPDSVYYRCGYSPDATGSNARGNLNAGVPYTTCEYTTDSCIARLGNSAATAQPAPIEADALGRTTGRFGGFQWIPPSSWNGRAYLDGSNAEGFNYTDSSTQYIPMVYGTCWVDCLVNQALGDPNSTRGEAIVCLGEIEEIALVVCNDTTLDASGDFLGNSYSVGDALLRWDPLNRGSRNGAVNYDAIFDGAGDPSGNICRIEYVALKSLVSSGSAPSVRALVKGPQIRKYHQISTIVVSSGVATVTFTGVNSDVGSNDPNYAFTISGSTLTAINGTHTHLTNWTWGPPGTVQFSTALPDGSGTGGLFSCRGYTENPAWQILDLLMWCSWPIDSIDKSSFISIADKCAALISYTDLSGTSASHARFSSSFTLRQRKAARDVINGLLRSFHGMLGFDPSTGLLQLWQRATLAEQQPTAVTGSNYSTAISSLAYDGTPTNGYSAYDFDESNIIEGTFKMLGASTMAMPNLVTSTLIDSDRQRVENTFSRVDADAVSRAGRTVSQNMSILGFQSWDQANRVSATILAETLRGNPWGDTRGTLRWEFQTTQKVAHLRLGHLCRLTWQADGIASQLVRVEKIAASKDFRRVTLTIAWHNDAWYVDTYGQTDDQTYGSSSHNRLARASFPWCPNKAFPASGDSMYSSTAGTFEVATNYESRADLTQIAQPVIAGKIPVNTFSTVKPPLTTIQGTTASTGGTIPGGTTYYLSVCAIDSSGQYSQPSSPVTAVAVPSGATNTITIRIVSWDPNTSAYAVYGGSNPNHLSLQATGSGKPATITLTAPLNEASAGIPDVEFDHFLVQAKRVIQGGVWGAGISSTASGAITIDSAAWPTNAWAGYDCSVVGTWDGSAVPVASFRVLSNTATTLTVTPDPVALGIDENHILFMRSKPVVAGLTLTDAMWQNDLFNGGAGLLAGGHAGNILRIIAGAGAGYTYKIATNTATSITVASAWIVTPDSSSRYIIEEPTWQVEKTSQSIDNADPTAEISLALDTENYTNQLIVIRVLTVDGGGSVSAEKDSPFREVIIVGNAGSFGSGSFTVASITEDTTIS